jgi:hypothetical protein
MLHVFLDPLVSNGDAGLLMKTSELARTWLVRLAMSFVIVAAVLGWDALRPNRVEPTSVKVWIEGIAAALSLGLGLAGIRERHRHRD